MHCKQIGSTPPEIALGTLAGTPTTTLLIANLPAHTHPLNAASDGSLADDPTDKALGVANIYTSMMSDLLMMTPTAIGIAGGSQPVSLIMPYTTMVYMICIQPSGCDGIEYCTNCVSVISRCSAIFRYRFHTQL